jgi:DNA repair exonuclease SbcCD nuclease subunit
MKFLHAADVHLDSPLHRLETYEGAPVAEIRNASRRAFENLIALALDEVVDGVLIAGDLFDGDWKDYNTGLFLVRQLRRLAEARIPVVIVAGNHDAAGRLTAELPYPSNVTLLSHLKPVTHLLEGPRIAIHGQSFARQAVTENLASAYPPPCSGYFNIGLLHTALNGREGHAPYAPCTVEELAAKGYDYWALGHVHRFEIVRAAPPIIFAGCIQGRHIREAGAKGCVLVHVDDAGAVQVTLRMLDVVRWILVEVDLSACTSVAHCLACWHERLQQVLPEHGALPLMVRAVFHGASQAHRLLRGDPEQWKQSVRAAALESCGEQVWVEKVVLATRDAAAATFSDPGGALSEISRFVETLRAAPETANDFVQRQLGELTRRLPPELASLNDPEAATELLAQAQALLTRRVHDEERQP